MERVTISLEDDLLDQFDGYIRRKGYLNRSEAIRDLLRACLEQDRLEENRAEYAMGCLSYVYNHHQRDLSRRLAKAQHAHHDLVLSTLHVHLDAENCLEVTVLQGPTAGVRNLAESLIAETGVHHGHLHLVPKHAGSERHHHHDHDHDHPHQHNHCPSEQ